MVEALCYKPEHRGSIPDITGFFNSPNPSSRTMALGSTQPLTEMSTRNIPGGAKGGLRVRPTICLEGLTNAMKTLSQAEIRTDRLPNTSLERYLSTVLFRCFLQNRAGLTHTNTGW
jgi:hypothetical protein